MGDAEQVSIQVQYKASLLSSDTRIGNWQEVSWFRESKKLTRGLRRIKSNYS